MTNKTQIEVPMSPKELIPHMILESPSKSHQYEDVLSPTKSEQDSLTESFSESNLDSPIQSVPGFDIDNKPPPGSGSLPRKSIDQISSNSRSLLNDSFTSASKENAVEIPDEPKVSVMDEILSVNDDVCKSSLIESIKNIASSGTNNSVKEEEKDELTSNYSINAQTVIHSEISECTENQAQDDPTSYNQEHSSLLESVHKPFKDIFDENIKPSEENQQNTIVALDAENCSVRKEFEIMSEENLKTDKYQKSKIELDAPAEEKGLPQQPESFHTEEIKTIQAEYKDPADLLKNVSVELEKGEVNLETGASLVKPPAGFGDSPEKSRSIVEQSKLEQEPEHVLTLSQVFKHVLILSI